MTTGSAEQKIQVVFEVAVGALQTQIKNTIKDIRGLGTEGNRAGRTASGGLDDMTDSADQADGTLRELIHNVQNMGNQLNRTGSAAERFSNKLKSAFQGLAFGLIAKQVVDLGKSAVTEYGKTQTALGEVASLGYEDLETLRQAAINFSDTWSGTTREGFISSAYDIKSGIASLSDEGVAKFTSMAGLTAKATKASIDEMTSLFATGYGIYRNMYRSDFDFGEKFSAGIAKSVQQFKTQGSEMASYLSTLGSSAAQAGAEMKEILAVGGTLQATMSGSEAATKYNSFLKNAVKASKTLGMNFTDSHNQLLSTADILELIHNRYGNILQADEKYELAQAFGDEEAVKLIENLYNKIREVRSAQEDVNAAMNEGTTFVERMANAMNKGMLEKVNLVKQRFANLLEKMGEDMEPGISAALDEVADKLLEIRNSADFSKIGAEIGRIVSGLAALVQAALESEALEKLLGFIADHIDEIIQLLQTGLEAWLAWQAASGVIGTLVEKFNELGDIIDTINEIIGLGQAIASLFTGTGALAGAFASLRTAVAAAWSTITGMFAALPLPIKGLIVGIGIVIAAIVGLIAWCKNMGYTWDDVMNKMSNGADTAKMAVLDLCKSAINGLEQLLRKIPLVGNALGDMAAQFSATMSNLRAEIQSVYDARNANTAKEATKGDSGMGDLMDRADQFLSDSNPNTNNNLFETPNLMPPKIRSSGGGGGTAKKWTIQDDIDKIEDKYDPELDLYESRADLAEKEKNTPVEKTNREAMIEVLNRQVKDLFNLEGRMGGNNKMIVETARNKLLAQIADITEDIRGGINDMVGEFSKPAGLDAMSKYDYIVSTTETESALYGSNNNIEFYMNVKDLGNLSMEQIREKAMEIIGYIGNPLMSIDDYKNAIAQAALGNVSAN